MTFPDRVRLPMRFDVGAMQRDLDLLHGSTWIAHFVAQNYAGDWSVLPLRAPAAAEHPIQMASSPPGCIDFVDTPFLAQASYLPQVIASFECTVLSARLMRLGAGSRIREHDDNDLDVAEGVARLHVPIASNSDVCFLLNDEPVDFALGECWYLRLSDRHSVYNGGSTDRVHLVIDIETNDWFHDQLRSASTPT